MKLFHGASDKKYCALAADGCYILSIISLILAAILVIAALADNDDSYLLFALIFVSAYFTLRLLSAHLRMQFKIAYQEDVQEYLRKFEKTKKENEET